MSYSEPLMQPKFDKVRGESGRLTPNSKISDECEAQTSTDSRTLDRGDYGCFAVKKPCSFFIC